MVVNREMYPISFEEQKSQALVCRYGEEGRQYVMSSDVDLSGLTVSLQIVKPDNTFVISYGEVIEPEEGDPYIRITIPLQATVVKGLAHYSIFVTDAADPDFVVYSAEGDLWVDDHLITDDMIESAAEVYGLRFPQDFLTVENLVDIVNYVTAQLLDDETISETTTWSSQKIDQEIAGATPEITGTAEGNPIEIADAASAPMVKCVTQITGYQEGTGTPSPDNIRPIVAYTEGEIEVSDGDGNTTTYTTTYPSAIYRGSEDVVKGGVTSEWPLYSFGDLTWNTRYTGSVNKTLSSNLPYQYDGTNCKIISEDLAYIRSVAGASILSDPDSKAVGIYSYEYGTINTDVIYLVVPIDYTPSCNYAYELATPTTSSVTPTNLPIKSLSGYTHIESSTGEMEVEYISGNYQALVDLIQSSSHVYSTAEQVVGKWIDGSTVYERVIEYATPFTIANDTWYTSTESYTGINILTNAWVINTDGAIYNGIIVLIQNSKLVIGNQTKTQPISNLKYVILRYTKTS